MDNIVGLRTKVCLARQLSPGDKIVFVDQIATVEKSYPLDGRDGRAFALAAGEFGTGPATWLEFDTGDKVGVHSAEKFKVLR